MANSVNDFDHGKWLAATEHLHFIGYKPPRHLTGDEIVKAIEKWHGGGYMPQNPPLFSMCDQSHLCERCQREINRTVNEIMRWPNDISGDPGTAAPEREEDEFGPITSRSRWLTPGSSTDYR